MTISFLTIRRKSQKTKLLIHKKKKKIFLKDNSLDYANIKERNPRQSRSLFVPNGTVMCSAMQTRHVVLPFSNENVIFEMMQLDIQQVDPKAMTGYQSNCSLFINSQIVPLIRLCLHQGKVIFLKVI